MRYLVFLIFVFSAACGSEPPLADASPSPEALAREVLLALKHADESRLLALAITDEEFRIHVWPKLPAARPERNLPIAYVWGDQRQKSDGHLQRTIAKYRNQSFEVTGVRFDGPATDYSTYKVHREAVFLVRTARGLEQLRVCGSLIEKDGAWKVFSYIVDE